MQTAQFWRFLWTDEQPLEFGMKTRHAAVLALVPLVFSACLPFPYRDQSPQLIGRVLNKDTQASVAGAEVVLDGYCTGTTTTGPDGRFELPAEKQWHFPWYIPLYPAEPGCQLTLRATGYQQWQENFLCYGPWRGPDVLLVPN